MKEFMDQDFLLSNQTAKNLYHQVAAPMPIIDYHCHIPPQELAENYQFENITEAWLAGDHYKWRLMRMNGVDEKYITGDSSDYEKFLAFATMLPRAIGNPVYHWAHLELQRYFDCHLPLSEDTAEEIWNLCNDKLQNDPTLRAQGIVQRSNVTTVVTTDDPVDDLKWHRQLAEDQDFDTAVLPAWRPDKAINIHKDGFNHYIGKLAQAADREITDFDSLCDALKVRLDYFGEHGCRASDHGVDGIYYAEATPEELNAITAKKLAGEEVSEKEAHQFQFAMLVFLGREYHDRQWVYEIHYGALRNTNTQMFDQLGADTGYDAINPGNHFSGLARLLDTLNQTDQLPKTILFSLNPNDDAALNTLAGCFQTPGIRGRVQQGAAWWFNDTQSGMIHQMTQFANLSLLGNFVGMLTDSRSLMSYTRHEYFRRILCNMLGQWVENGEYPNDEKHLKEIVEDICYNNAVTFFGY